MKRLLFLLSGIICIQAICFAQDLKVEIRSIRSAKGKIMVMAQSTSDAKPVYAMADAAKDTLTIVLKDASHENALVSVFHDENGNWTLDKNERGIPVEGYVRDKIKVKNGVSPVPQQAYLRDTLPIDSSPHLLKEVLIQANPIKREVDRYVLYVPSAISKDGVELLQQIPGVWLSNEQVSINGSQDTKIVIDNREIKLKGELLISYLRSLKSEDIYRIEVFPMAGADKDADARGGAIHIRMHRRLNRGIQGSLSMGTSFASSLQRYQPKGSLNDFYLEF